MSPDHHGTVDQIDQPQQMPTATIAAKVGAVWPAATRAGIASVVSVLAVSACVIAAALFAAPAQAASLSDSFPFGAVPAVQGHGIATSYFSLSVAAGGSEHEAVIISNFSATTPVKLKLGASVGVTATNGGYAYIGGFAHCTGAACWITGLPHTITVPAGKHFRAPFSVSVPASAPNKQYLAAISIEPAKKPTSASVGGSGVSAAATIVHVVNVGVAITVGDPTTLSRRLKIAGVTATHIGSMPRLLVEERNTGQTFVSAKGTTACTVNGHRYAYSVVSLTILPGDSAQLAVNATGMPDVSSANCMAELNYGGAAPAVWHGKVAVGASRQTKMVHIKPGVFSAIPKAKVETNSTVPSWLIIAGAVMAVLVIGLILVLLWILRGRSGGSAGIGSGPRPGSRSPVGGPSPVTPTLELGVGAPAAVVTAISEPAAAPAPVAAPQPSVTLAPAMVAEPRRAPRPAAPARPGVSAQPAVAHRPSALRSGISVHAPAAPAPVRAQARQGLAGASVAAGAGAEPSGNRARAERPGQPGAAVPAGTPLPWTSTLPPNGGGPSEASRTSTRGGSVAPSDVLNRLRSRSARRASQPDGPASSPRRGRAARRG